jgi:hypothetical protein
VRIGGASLVEVVVHDVRGRGARPGQLDVRTTDGTPRPRQATLSRVRVVLIGEFGGVPPDMVRYALERTKDLPKSLTLEGQLEHDEGAGRDASKPRLTAIDPDALSPRAGRVAVVDTCLGHGVRTAPR